MLSKAQQHCDHTAITNAVRDQVYA